MAALGSYAWPGNVRELEHLIERAVILTPGGELRVRFLELAPRSRTDCRRRLQPAFVRAYSSGEASAHFIQRTLHECGWVIGGPKGAATRLGLKRTTLLSRMKKLGLSRPDKLRVSNNRHEPCRTRRHPTLVSTRSSMSVRTTTPHRLRFREFTVCVLFRSRTFLFISHSELVRDLQRPINSLF